jgi:zinc finger protein 830
VRKVEFKDPLDDQWEEFQKTISKESEKSEAIVEVGDEEMKEDREVSEVKEQVYCYERAEKLRIKQEKIAKCIVKSEVPPNIKEESNSSDDEADLEDLLDWRFKS